MSQKNETTVLVLTLVLTLGVIGAIVWWFTNRNGINLNNAGNTPSLPTTATEIETFAQVQGVPRGVFNYGGSSTWSTIRREVDPAIETVWPSFRLRYTDPRREAPSSGQGIRMLIENELSFSQSARPIESEEYQQAQQRGFTLKEIPVAIDAIAVVVNPNLNIPGLTVAQFDDIYAGKITNWREVGGPDLRIQAYGKPERDNGDYIQFVGTTTEALRAVSTNLGGIYYASAPLLIPQCTVKTLPIGRISGEFIAPYQEPFVPLSQCPQQRNEINIESILNGNYPLSRRLIVVVKKNGQIDEQAGEAYAALLSTEQGQALIEKAGFVRIR